MLVIQALYCNENMKPLRTLLNWPVDTCIFFFSLSLSYMCWSALKFFFKTKKMVFCFKTCHCGNQKCLSTLSGDEMQTEQMNVCQLFAQVLFKMATNSPYKMYRMCKLHSQKIFLHAEHPKRPIVFLSILKTLPCLIKTPLHQGRKLPLHSAQHLQAGGISG